MNPNINSGNYTSSGQASIIEAFNSTTYIQDRMDVQHTPLYDTIIYAAAATITENNSFWFSNVGSQSGKTYGQTNLNQSQRLQAPEAFSIFAFRIRWSEDINPIDAAAIVNTLAMQFFLGTKPYQRAPLWHYNAGGGLNIMQANNFALGGGFTTWGPTYTGNGIASREAMHKLAIPIVIENQMNFYAQLAGNNYTLLASGVGGTGATVTLLLDGLYARGVQ